MVMRFPWLRLRVMWLATPTSLTLQIFWAISLMVIPPLVEQGCTWKEKTMTKSFLLPYSLAWIQRWSLVMHLGRTIDTTLCFACSGPTFPQVQETWMVFEKGLSTSWSTHINCFVRERRPKLLPLMIWTSIIGNSMSASSTRRPHVCSLCVESYLGPRYQ
jgi:hypothetical protein